MGIEKEVKAIARENGAALVGIAARERLSDAPPSADPGYLLPATRSIVSFAIPLDRRTIRDYLSKKEWLAHGNDQKSIYQKLYTISDRLSDFLKGKGYDALGIEANSVYRPEDGTTEAKTVSGLGLRVDLVPDFSHRFGAVAAGLGRLGWSGNLMTPQFGSAVFLATVLTSAEMESDPLMEEDPCDKCKLCTTVCPVEMISNKQTMSVTIAGREHSYGRKGHNARCIIGCAGYHGLAPNKKWSTWSPFRVDYPFSYNVADVIDLSRRVRSADPDRQGTRAFLTQRDKCFNPNETYTNTCGNCGLICWEKREDREANRRLLMESGVVVLNAEGQRVAVPAGEAAEIGTPYEVRVAVPHQEARAAPIPMTG